MPQADDNWSPVGDAAIRAVSETLQANGCMLEAIVAQIDYIDSDGQRCWAFIALPGQYAKQSVQMAAHLHEYYQELQRQDLRRFIRRQQEQ